MFLFSSLTILHLQPLTKCRRVFQSLINIAIEELCEIADALISPVRLGVARPTAPFSLVSTNLDAIQGSEELFMLDPMPTRTTGGSSDLPSGTDHSFLPTNAHSLHSPVQSPTHQSIHIDTQEDRASIHDDQEMAQQNNEEVSDITY